MLPVDILCRVAHAVDAAVAREVMCNGVLHSGMVFCRHRWAATLAGGPTTHHAQSGLAINFDPINPSSCKVSQSSVDKKHLHILCQGTGCLPYADLVAKVEIEVSAMQVHRGMLNSLGEIWQCSSVKWSAPSISAALPI